MAKRKQTMGKTARRADDGDIVAYWRQPKSAVHTFTRLVPPNDIPKGASDQTFGISFKLSDVPNSTEFTTLYDQYRINWVDYIFTLKQTISGRNAPTIYYAEDHDSDAAPAVNEVYSSQNVQVLQFGTDRVMLKMRVVPNTTRQVFNGVAAGYERSPPGTWIDCGSPGVPHYGFKY